MQRIEAIEKAGAFENLKLRNEKEQKVESEPFWKQKENSKVYISAFYYHQLDFRRAIW